MLIIIYMEYNYYSAGWLKDLMATIFFFNRNNNNNKKEFKTK